MSLPVSPVAYTATVATHQAGSDQGLATRSVLPTQHAATHTQTERNDTHQATSALSKILQVSDQSIRFSMDEDTQQMVIRIIDVQTEQVLRQIPAQELLDLAKSLDRMRGLLINKTA